MMTSMLHAREWVTTPVALYAVHRLVEELRSEDQDLLQNIDWIIMPLVNPDGYEYTHTDVKLLSSIYSDFKIKVTSRLISIWRPISKRSANLRGVYIIPGQDKPLT